MKQKSFETYTSLKMIGWNQKTHPILKKANSSSKQPPFFGVPNVHFPGRVGVGVPSLNPPGNSPKKLHPQGWLPKLLPGCWGCYWYLGCGSRDQESWWGMVVVEAVECGSWMNEFQIWLGRGVVGFSISRCVWIFVFLYVYSIDFFKIHAFSMYLR